MYCDVRLEILYITSFDKKGFVDADNERDRQALNILNAVFKKIAPAAFAVVTTCIISPVHHPFCGVKSIQNGKNIRLQTSS